MVHAWGGWLQESNALPVTIVERPVLLSIDPTSVVATYPTLLTARGTGFAEGATIFVTGMGDQPTTYVSDTELTAYVSITAGDWLVEIHNPVGSSNTLPITATEPDPVPGPAPRIDWVYPEHQVVNATVEHRVQGVNFVDGAFVAVDGVPVPTTFVDATDLRFTITPTETGILSVRVHNADAGRSNAFPVIVSLTPWPSLTSIDPTEQATGVPTIIRAFGTNFAEGANIHVTAFGDQPTTRVSDTELVTTGPITFTNDGLYGIQVQQLDGSYSNSIQITISDPPVITSIAVQS
jgi:hypothetical protein